MVAWQTQNADGDSLGVQARQFDTFGAPLGDEFQVNTYTTAAQYSPRVATDASGNFVVVWSSYVQTGEDAGGIFGQRFDSTGAPVGGEFHVNSYTTGAQYQPAVAMNAGGRFVVVWTSAGQDGDGYGVFAQRYDPDGSALGGEFQVNTTTTGNQYAPSVAMDTTGTFFVVWSGGSAGSSSYDVFGRRYGPAGNALGSEFQVNAQTGVDARLPSVATDNDGDAVVVWQQPDADGTGVYGQRFDESGQPEALPFRANTHTAGGQSRPWAAFDATHEFVVVWDGEGQDDPGDATSLGVFAQRFGDPNVPVGGEFAVNVYTTGNQSHPAVSMNASGNFAIAWESDGQDGSILGIFARRAEFHAAKGMAVDAHGTGTTASNLNGVLEPGETVQVEPSFQNTLAVDAATFRNGAEPGRAARRELHHRRRHGGLRHDHARRDDRLPDRVRRLLRDGGVGNASGGALGRDLLRGSDRFSLEDLDAARRRFLPGRRSLASVLRVHREPPPQRGDRRLRRRELLPRLVRDARADGGLPPEVGARLGVRPSPAPASSPTSRARRRSPTGSNSSPPRGSPAGAAAATTVRTIRSRASRWPCSC